MHTHTHTLLSITISTSVYVCVFVCMEKGLRKSEKGQEAGLLTENPGEAKKEKINRITHQSDSLAKGLPNSLTFLN